MPIIERVTMFKIADKADREKLLDAYDVMKADAKKDCKAYILSCEAGHTADETRAQGWTLAAKTTFGSKEDMDYYDVDCKAHAALKEVAAPIRTDLMTVWFERRGEDAKL